MVKFENGNIYFHAPGTVSIKAADHTWGGPASMSVASQQFPSSEIAFDQEFLLHLHNGEPVTDRRFLVEFADGGKLPGKSDAQGKTGIKQSALTGKYSVKILPPEAGA
jgi:uncharacterized protein (DUF2345 family)